jgi:hypothetical protein
VLGAGVVGTVGVISTDGVSGEGEAIIVGEGVGVGVGAIGSAR